MIFFPFFSILVVSMMVFAWCGFEEHQSVRIHRAEVVSLYTMLISFGVMLTDTAFRAYASLG